ncbi:6PF2K-domain-containing protein [Metschnikowia bicuspidata var. bicuspidata NRRL YB-4993]|uniref:6PF2K-domain-containing protein n=1 Tax=Metschnikowia bicuspidata var. bicuspidata NRRL YB-4993 TaxID=869754 RepID=A0A1A0HL37_9ASCO|nr:6PF2K-domain-containing protein [Metschnikowia bicuspidata var. bicuspidata NRRL YB-4993]OBA24523.1 6PF2K-domain-containing protein [Metschnikowia bicuspidata var. bicuspidata NRRL YB-4993]
MTEHAHKDAARPQRHRSLSISNAVLEHLRLAGKHVAFNKKGDVIVGLLTMSPASPASPCSISDCDEEDGAAGAAAHGPSLAHRLTAVAGADERDLAARKISMPNLTRFCSHPHPGTFSASPMRLSALFYSHQSSHANLPEFNKRPLTDTPIVSSVTSPETRCQSSDDEDDTLFSLFKTPGDRMPQPRAPGAAPPADALRKTKNISHLSLTDLNACSPAAAGAPPVPASRSVLPRNTDVGTPLSPSTAIDTSGLQASEDVATVRAQPMPEPPGAPEPPSMPGRATSDKHVPVVRPLAVKAKSSVSSAELTRRESSRLDPDVFYQLTEDLIQDAPPDLQNQFGKTPSFEKLKNLLLLKPFPKAKKAYTLNIPGQTSSKISPDGKIASVDVGSKLVIVMVGLPARGKSYITNKLTRYLNWIQHDCRVFNVGNTRRMDKDNALGPAHRPLPDTNTPLPFNGQSPLSQPISPTSHSADFFNPQNEASNHLREKWAMDTLDSLLDWVLNGFGSVGILDATNSTVKRRLKVLKRIQERTNGELKVLFLESICSDPAILDTNIRLKLSGPDYRDMDPEIALKDFLGRLRNYEKAYETIDEVEEATPGYQYVKMIDVGKKVVSYNVQGFLASQTIYFLLNFNLCERQIWLTRHGESVDNLIGRIGGDSGLTKRGRQFSKALNRFLSYQRREFRKKQLERFSSRLELRYNELTGKQTGKGALQDNHPVEIPTEPNFCVWTSMLVRSVESGNCFNDQEYNVKAMRMLNELGGGKFDGMTYDEIRRKHPKEYESRIKNKLSYRYPGVGGESYLDVLVRLRPLINEIERTTDHLLIISHRVVLRVLLAYFMNLDKSSIVELDVPLHTLYCLELNPYGTDYKMFEYDEETDWFRKVEPEHQKNVKEVGVNFRERKYSVIPTAPPLLGKSRKEVAVDSISGGRQPAVHFSIRASLGQGLEEKRNDEERILSLNSSSSRKLADLNKMRMP